MRSINSQYYLGLDHLRALAAFMVFCWHFLHGTQGFPIEFGYQPDFAFLSLLNEGHLGVSLFMVLSGYLFAKILDQKEINYISFYLNRFLRLAPLMIFVVFINAVIREINGETSVWYFFASLANGLVFPYLPNSGWSITVEFHFYLLLPMLLLILKRSALYLLVLIAVAIALRYWVYLELETIRLHAYWTIIGRLDLFILGILGCYFSSQIRKYKLLFIAAVFGLIYFYSYFNGLGGYKATKSSLLWVYMHTIEGFFLAILITFYDKFSVNLTGNVSVLLAKVGQYSYSMYLLHMFFVFWFAKFIHHNVMLITNIYVALLFAVLGFFLMIPIAYLSYTFIEKPFLEYRVKYLQ